MPLSGVNPSPTQDERVCALPHGYRDSFLGHLLCELRHWRRARWAFITIAATAMTFYKEILVEQTFRAARPRRPKARPAAAGAAKGGGHPATPRAGCAAGGDGGACRAA